MNKIVALVPVKILVVVAVLLFSVLVSVVLMATKPQLQPREVKRNIITVRVAEVAPKSMQLKVQTQGVVAPSVESQLTSEVAGKVVWVAPALVSGGHFDSGELLLRIDDSDYQTNLERATAGLIRAEVEHEYAEKEFGRQDKLRQKSLASQAQLDDARSRFRLAEAGLREAKVNVAQAKLDIKRTEIHAPYNGRVRSEHVDAGQFVSRGEAVATVYDSSAVEIRLPIANRQFAYLDLPSDARGLLQPSQTPIVDVTANYAGLPFAWQGRLVRTEAEIDERSRMFYGVVRVENTSVNPVQVADNSPALLVGLFVDAYIHGRTVDNVIELPRSAIRNKNEVLVVDEQNRVSFRRVDILRIQQDSVIISGGLEAGEKVCLTAMQIVVQGMQINPLMVVEDNHSAQPLIVDAELPQTAPAKAEALVPALVTGDTL
ncbi:Multidrug resistance protein MdtE [Sinobacterium norvegicum]|uniref:Multidrug resistance protein MdtE n=1 Tax=Sinobacterium norvegicum TaxID=1641715 RepID=A0ABN8ELV5_9GAMM|nr:efflux RND transporter periplasmic adaptor subunit [Sinobacterium norvegicum]CAH0992382.1 Multidrug resistance protein MdtE [Sinobacterium norvegicum]